jgi:predicted acetyltransferase
MQVRTIDQQELVAWVAANHVPFLETGSITDEAEYRRTRIDFERTWATFDGEQIVGTLRSFATPLTVPGGAQLAVDAVTNVAVSPTHRRRGVMTGLIQNTLAKAAERGEPASILIAAEYPIYGRFGYGPATEHASYTLDTHLARIAMARVGSVEVVAPEVARQAAQPVFEQFRSQQAGAIRRRDYGWDIDFGLSEWPERPRWKGFCVLYSDPTGAPRGYLRYHVDSNWEHRLPRNKVVVDELVSVTPTAYTELWRYLTELDLVATVSADDRPVDEPLYWQLADARALRQTSRDDFLWLRVLDAPAALSARTYASANRAVIEIVDPLGYANGRVALEAGPDGATCRPTSESADVSIPIGALGAAYLGGPSLAVMQHAGLIDEHQSGAVARLDAQFASRPAPWCNTWF